MRKPEIVKFKSNFYAVRKMDAKGTYLYISRFSQFWWGIEMLDSYCLVTSLESAQEMLASIIEPDEPDEPGEPVIDYGDPI